MSLLELTDLSEQTIADLAPECEGPYDGDECGKVATHVARWSCGCLTLLCLEHAAEVLRDDQDPRPWWCNEPSCCCYITLLGIDPL
jgi:hypothetical protein